MWFLLLTGWNTWNHILYFPFTGLRVHMTSGWMHRQSKYHVSDKTSNQRLKPPKTDLKLTGGGIPHGFETFMIQHIFIWFYYVQIHISHYIAMLLTPPLVLYKAPALLLANAVLRALQLTSKYVFLPYEITHFDLSITLKAPWNCNEFLPFLTVCEVMQLSFVPNKSMLPSLCQRKTPVLKSTAV